jgi:hypothetical protein
MRPIALIIAILIIVGGLFLVLQMVGGALARLSPKRNTSMQTCVSHQKQLATAFLMYVQDWNLTFSEPKDGAWSRQFALYLPDSKANVADCPASPRQGRLDAPDYGINANLFGVRVDTIAHPAATLLTADLAEPAMQGSHALRTEADLGLRHVLKRGVVVSALDGHAVTVIREAEETLPAALKRVDVTLIPTLPPKP